MLHLVKKKKHIKKKRISIIALLIIALAIGFYFIFLKPTYINCGMLLEKKSSSRGTFLKLKYDNKTYNIKVNKNNIPDAIAYDVIKKGIMVKNIYPCTEIKGTLISFDNKKVELKEGTFLLNSEINYYNNKLDKTGTKNLLPGSTKCKFIKNHNEKIGAIITENPDIEKLRVGISTSDFSSLKHLVLNFTSKKGININILDKTINLKRGLELKTVYKDGSIELYSIDKDNVETLLDKTSARVYVASADPSSPISCPSLARSTSFTPSYYGVMEISINDDSMKLINEVDIEDYLRYVVPSEMPSSGGVEAYKVQAIAARTYAISDMLSGRFRQQGFHVDDSTLSQVYNGQPSNSLSDKAIADTKGLIMTYNNNIIDAKYYSTSCGVGAPFNEVWFNNKSELLKNKEPYLTFNDYTESNISSLSDNEKASQFLKDWTIKSYDSFSQFYRWKIVNISGKDFNSIVKNNIYSLYVKHPKNFKYNFFLNFYKPAVIRKKSGNTKEADLDDVTDFTITKRGKAGNVMEAVIKFGDKNYKVIGENIIRNLITPSDSSFELIPIYGSKFKCPRALPSGFFVIEKEMSSKGIKNINIYGGGFGHGVGMSQYGAIGLARQGKNYDEILKTYYKGIEIKSYTDLFK